MEKNNEYRSRNRYSKTWISKIAREHHFHCTKSGFHLLKVPLRKAKIGKTLFIEAFRENVHICTLKIELFSFAANHGYFYQ